MNVFSLTKFSTSSQCACEQQGAPHWKTQKDDIFEETEFYDFLKNRNFRNLTTDFENRTKPTADTKACVFLGVDH